MNRPRTLLLAAVALGLSATSASADGWPQKKGRGYYSFGINGFRATNYYEPNGTRIKVPTVGFYAIQLYGEYGVTDRFTVIAYVPVERITLNRQVGRATGDLIADGDAVNGLADIVAGVRVGLLQHGNSVASAVLRFGIPVGSDDQPNGLYTGDGEFNQQLTLEFGHSLYPRPGYFTASVGFNQRSRGFSDEVVYALQFGYSLATRVGVDLRVDGVESTKNGEAIGGGLGFRGNNQGYLRYGAKVRYSVTPQIDLAAGAERMARARNVLSSTGFSFAIAYKS